MALVLWQIHWLKARTADLRAVRNGRVTHNWNPSGLRVQLAEYCKSGPCLKRFPSLITWCWSTARGWKSKANRVMGAAINLLVLDIQMPHLDGRDTMERIHELGPQVPVLLLSGGMSDSPADVHRRHRTAGVLRKPFASKKLLHALRLTLDRCPGNP